MLVSVIIPFYKGNLYINRLLLCLETNIMYCERESANIFLETIIINDSPDEKVVLKKSYPKCNIKVYKNQSNKGIHYSRVHGIKLARGEYIILLDQDDMLEDRAILSQSEAIRDGDIVFSDGYIESFRDGKEKRFTIFRNKIIAPYVLNLKTYLCASNPIVSPGQVMMKRSSIPETWLQYILRENGSDDLFLWILFLSQGPKAYYNSDILYIHKYTGENYSLNEQRMLQSDIKVYDLLQEQHLIEQKYLDMFRSNNLYKKLKLEKTRNIIAYLHCSKIVLYRSVYRLIRGIGKGIYLLKNLINNKTI